MFRHMRAQSLYKARSSASTNLILPIGQIVQQIVVEPCPSDQARMITVTVLVEGSRILAFQI
jgi:hypothetical protein